MFYRIIFVLLFFLSIVDAKDIRLELNKLIKSAFAQQKSLNSIVSLASNNKMLSQRMAKCAVLIKNGIYVDDSYKELVKSAKEFDRFVEGMYHGNSAIGIKKESDKKILVQLDEVDSIWKPFYNSIKHLYINGDFNQTTYRYIINNNEKLLRLSHKLMQTIQSKNILNTYDNQVIVHTLKFADRQKMLTQKMLKEKFLVFTNENRKINNIKLRGSIILFKNGLHGLIYGDKKRGLAKVTNIAILKKLMRMQELYLESEALYKKPKVTLKEMKHLSHIDKELLNLSSDIVTMIEQTLVY